MLEGMNPPNWAHSDYNMTKCVALIYLSSVNHPGDGTHFVRHKRLGFETHPENQEQLDVLLSESNQKENWEITYTCPARFNRAFLFDARYLHAASPCFGTTKEEGRLVLTAFFNVINE